MQLFTDIYTKVMDGKYADVKSSIAILEKMQNKDIKRLCASLHFAGGDINQAIEAYESADTLNSGNVDSLMILAKCYRMKRNPKAAIACYEAILKLEPDNHTAHGEMVLVIHSFQHKDDTNNIVMQNLFKEKGFRGFFKVAVDRTGGVPLETLKGQIPLWTGEKVDRLLIVCDMGNGDGLQFIRYAKLARQLCNHLTVAAYPALMSLFALNPDIDSIINAEAPHTAADMDAYTTAYILPYILNAGYEPEPYIHIQGEKLPGFNVGVCWRGNTLNPTDHFRSASYEVLKAFEGFKDITFHSLQVGAEADKAPSWMVRHRLVSYEATARVIASLDLVISVDTSVCHLAGAMGKPVWIGLGLPSCWRWEDNETFTQWYNTARLFRNKTDWQTTFNRMAAELKKLRYRLKGI